MTPTPEIPTDTMKYLVSGLIKLFKSYSLTLTENPKTGIIFAFRMVFPHGVCVRFWVNQDDHTYWCAMENYLVVEHSKQTENLAKLSTSKLFLSSIEEQDYKNMLEKAIEISEKLPDDKVMDLREEDENDF